jgi:hypothetical protein
VQVASVVVVCAGGGGGGLSLSLTLFLMLWMLRLFNKQSSLGMVNNHRLGMIDVHINSRVCIDGTYKILNKKMSEVVQTSQITLLQHSY